MSGIAGLVNLDGAPADAALLERMTAYMAFRGPDAHGTWAAGQAGLGHRLLRTTFESAREKQPCSLDGAVWIAADARVDGRAELLAGLRAKGRTVEADAPDAELILHAYHAWGEGCLERLIGDFAFAIWDGPRRRLLCAHDQFGVVPFYYAQTRNSLLFSNTLNTLRLHPGLPDELNEQALADTLLFGMNHDQTTTAFTAIQQLPPAHKLTWSDGRLAVARYWSPPGSSIVYRRPQDTIEAFRALLEQAVGDRLRFERVSAQLSGGMDSGSVAAIAARLRDRDGVPAEIRVHTQVFRHLMEDQEERFSRLIAEQARLPLELVVLDDETDEKEPEEPAPPAPEPGALPVRAANRAMGRRMRQFSPILLSGFGGDPLLHPAETYLWELGRTFQWGRLAQGLSLAWRMQGDLPPLYARSLLKRRFGRLPRQPLPGWLNPAFVKRLGLAERWRRQVEQPGLPDFRRDMVDNVFWSSLFAKADAGYTGVPLEVRFPFFDARLLAFVMTVPPVPWFVNKLLLREAMRDIMPELVRVRPKTPLGAFPLQVQAEQRGQQAWMLEMAGAPELEPYVDRKRLLLTMKSPSRLGGFEYSQFLQPLVLAYWLRSQRRPEIILSEETAS